MAGEEGDDLGDLGRVGQPFEKRLVRDPVDEPCSFIVGSSGSVVAYLPA